MKHKLLSLVALAGAMFTSVSAWAVDPPTEVEPGYTTDWTAPQDGGVYFIYNVGADQFLGAGNNWGTHVVTAAEEDGVIPLYYWDAGVALSGGQSDMNVGMILPMKLTKTENGTWYIEHMGSNRTACFLSSEDGNSWIDCDAGRRIDFIITESDGGYTIQATNTVEAGTYFGAVDPETEPEEYQTVVRNVMNNVTAETGHIIWRFAPTNYVQCMAYDNKLALYNKIVEAEENGVDTSAAAAVYNNTASTAKDMEDAMTALTLAINKKKFAELFKGASENNPMDITEYAIQNPTFDSGIDGWFITVTGQNLGWQQRTDTNPNTGEYITNFIEAWIPSGNVLGDGVVAQTVYGLPDGKYVLELDATACHDPASGDGTDIEGVYVFIQSGSQEKRTPVKTIRLGVTHFSVAYVHDGSDELTFGLKVEGTNANWISADNFKVTYYGQTTDTPEMAALKEAINKAEELQDNMYGNDIENNDNLNISAAAANSLKEALTKGQIARDSEEGIEEATEALNQALEEVSISAETYKAYQQVFINAMLTAQKLTDANQWKELSDEILDYAEVELTEAFNAGNLTNEGLAEAQGKVAALIADFLNDPEKIQEGDDLTVLLVNPDFSTGSTNDPTGWTINNGSMTELRLRTKNIETYHKQFDLSQTLHNMPKGVYDITLQGFARHDGGDTDKTWLYGGITRTYLISLNDDENQMREEPIYSDATLDTRPNLGDANYDNTASNGLYKANGMTGAYYWFQEINPNTDEPYYTNHVKVVLDAPGDLTIGIHSETDTDWVIFSNFGIVFRGEDLSVYYKMIDEQGVVLEETVAAYPMTEECREIVTALQKRIDHKDDLTTTDEAVELLADIEKAITTIKEAQALMNQVVDVYQNYRDKAELAEITDKAYLSLLDEVDNKIASEAYKSNVEIKNDIQKMTEGFVPAVVAGAQPGDDITAVLNNADFEAGNANYWEVNIEGGNQGFQNNATYTSTTEEGEDITLSNFVEAWRNGAILNDGDISQTIAVALPEGYYQLAVDGYAVNQGGEPEEGVQGVYLYAKVGDTYMTTPIGISGTSGQPQNWTVDFHSNGVDLTTVGLLVQGANCNWTAADNFKLTYLGTTPPDAVESIAAETNAAAKTIYTIDGRQASTLRRGINIVRRADGTVQKVLVK